MINRDFTEKIYTKYLNKISKISRCKNIKNIKNKDVKRGRK